MEGIKYMLAPPLRKAEDNQALWKALADGTVQTVATDHCPFTIAEKQENVSDFRNCPGGVSGVEERMPLLFSEGVLKGRLTLERFVQVTSANVAQKSLASICAKGRCCPAAMPTSSSSTRRENGPLPGRTCTQPAAIRPMKA